GLFVRRVLAAPPTELLELEPVGMRALVLRGRVVPPLARGAREGDDLPHRLLRDLRDDAGPHRPPPLPSRPLQLPLHRPPPIHPHLQRPPTTPHRKPPLPTGRG